MLVLVYVATWAKPERLETPERPERPRLVSEVIPGYGTVYLFWRMAKGVLTKRWVVS